jgi:very-short-patch-repair endonuclease
MSYTNQLDHRILDRQKIRELLQRLGTAQVAASPGAIPRAEHLLRLKNQCQSGLERQWLDALEARGGRLPSHAQHLMDVCSTRPDFIYDDRYTVIYVDGPHHQFPDRHTRDAAQQACLEDNGYTVLRFAESDQWNALFATHSTLFGLDGAV